MWFAFALWLWRGPDAMSIQPDIPGPDERTIHDVERDLFGVNALVVAHRARLGPTTNKRECIDQEPADLVRDVNDYIDEWAWMRAGLDALDFPVDEPAIAHGNLDAGCA